MLAAENVTINASKADKKCHDDNKKRYNTDAGKVRSGFYTKRKGWCQAK